MIIIANAVDTIEANITGRLDSLDKIATNLQDSTDDDMDWSSSSDDDSVSTTINIIQNNSHVF